MNKEKTFSWHEWIRYNLEHSEEFIQKKDQYFKMAIISGVLLLVNTISGAWWVSDLPMQVIGMSLQITIGSCTLLCGVSWINYRFKIQNANDVIEIYIDELLKKNGTYQEVIY